MVDFETYKDLKIWQKGIVIVKLTYALTKAFPEEEKFGLVSQMRRSAVSIPSNIAEGWGRNYTKNDIQFLKIARGSLLELETQLIIALELDFISADAVVQLSDTITEENKMLNAFIRSIERKVLLPTG